MRLAAQEDLLDGATIDERFNAAETLQLDGLELWSAGLAERLDKIRGLSRLMGIRVPVVSASLRTSLLAAEQEEQRFTAAELRRLLGLCAKIGALGLVYVPAYGGPRLAKDLPLDQARAEARKLLPERLRDMARTAAEDGVRLLLEPVNRSESYALNTVAEASALCRAVGSEGLGVCANLYHLRLEGETPAAAARQAGDTLRYVHVSDSGRRLPGHGSADLAAELAALRQHGYDGFLGVEAHVPGQNASLRRFFARELPPALDRLRAALPQT
ncbi:MAG: sugar phosphate isomerase/epimerase [Chloroflexi bacterium]|nr:sugar phosphate isomerase/epimerase [Chloroflexota bacterium]